MVDKKESVAFATQARFLPLIALGLLSLIWGYNWVIMKMALTDSPPLVFAALRVVCGAAALFVLLIFLRRPLRMPPARYVIPLGLLQTTGFVGFSIWALDHAGAGKTAILVYMMPVWLMVFAWPILHERIHGRQWLVLLLALVGLVFILEPWRIHGHLLGTLLAILGGVFWAASTLWQKKRAPVGLDLLNVTAWQMAWGGTLLTIMAVGLEPLHVHWTPLFIGALFYNAIPGSAVALLLWGYAVASLPSGIAGMATLVTPLIGVLAAWLQLGERPGLWEASGMAVIFLALMLITWHHLRIQNTPLPEASCDATN